MTKTELEVRDRLKAEWPKGSARPAGYLAIHEWMEAQNLHGLRQSLCKRCRRYFFPQEKAAHRCVPITSPGE